MELTKEEFLEKYQFPDDDISNHIFNSLNGDMIHGIWEEDYLEELKRRMKIISENIC